ncbi:exonuclease SbcCD subunit D [Chloroflexota bacterium]
MTKPNKKQIRLIHTSDLHIGEDYRTGFGFDDGGCRLLKALVDLSLSVEAHLVVIAGDFFDNNQVGAARVDMVVRELARALVPVVILPGNHDCLVRDTVYRRIDFAELTPNIRIFTSPEGERFVFSELGLAIWGKAINSYEGEFRPMAGVPPRGGEDWQIAVAHGYYAGDSIDKVYSYQISEAEIVQSGYDYVALGHWGVFRCVCDRPVKSCYSGSASQTGKAVIVDLLGDGGIHLELQPLPL